MSNYVDVAIKVPKEAVELLNDFKNAEIVLRNTKKRYLPFIDCIILQNPDLDAKKVNDVLSPSTKSLAPKKTEDAIHVMKNLVKHSSDLENTVKNLSDNISDFTLNFENLVDSMKLVNKLQFLNVALNGLNLAATVAGIIIIENKLNQIDQRIKELDAKIVQLKDIEFDKVQSEFHSLVMRFNSLATKIKDHDTLSRDEMDAYLRNSNTFIKDRLVNSIKNRTFEVDTMLSMINALITAYKVILIEFKKDYYFDKHGTHGNERTYMSLFYDLQSSEFINSIHDYLFLEKGLHANEATIAITIQKILVNEQLIEIYDQMTLMKDLNTKEKYAKLENIVNESLRQYAVNVAENNAEENEVDISDILPAINKSYKMVSSLS
ncbi:MAG: hypothetical protein IJI75_04250 [Solobacterium sp.]|nr:hypothetical protein [Solobacterium sp.]